MQAEPGFETGHSPSGAEKKQADIRGYIGGRMLHMFLQPKLIRDLKQVIRGRPGLKTRENAGKDDKGISKSNFKLVVPRHCFDSKQFEHASSCERSTIIVSG